MKSTLSHTWIRTWSLWGLCLVEAVFFLPVLLLGYTYLVPGLISPAWLCVLPFVTLVGILLRGWISVLWKQAGVSLLLGGAAAAAASALGGNPAIGMALGAVFAYHGLTSGRRDQRIRLYWLGLGLYLLAGMVYSRIPALSGWLTLLTWAGVFCLAWTLFVANRNYLKYSTMAYNAAGQKLPRGLRGHNSIWIAAIVVLAVLMAAGTGRWIGSILLNTARQLFSWLFKPGEEPAPELPPEEESEAASPVMPLFEQPEPNRWTEFLNGAFYVLGTVAIIALAILVIVLIYKNAGGMLRQFMNRLLGWLKRTGREEPPTDFVDDETKLGFRVSGDKKWSELLNPLLSRFGRRERWEDMRDNRERIRFLYRRLLQTEQADGYAVKPYLTPMETEKEIRGLQGETAGKRSRINARSKRRPAADKLIQAYYRIRYGEREPEPAEVEQLRKDLDV